MQNGFVAVLKVLEFGSIVSTDADRLAKYLPALDKIFDPAQGASPDVDYFVSSDRIVLLGKGVTDTPAHALTSLKAVVKQCARLAGLMLRSKFGVCGAIAYGPYVRSAAGATKVLVAGASVIEAQHYEAVQDWAGILIAPSVHIKCGIFDGLLRLDVGSPQQIIDVRNNLEWSQSLQPYASIPFEESFGGDSKYEGYAIVPSSGAANATAIRANLQNAKFDLGQLKLIASSPEKQLRYSRSIQFLNELLPKWDAVVAALP